MQKFKLVVEVTVNTLEEISSDDVVEEIKDLLEDFIGGTATVTEVSETG